MESVNNLSCSIRKEYGKGASRRLRRNDQVPGVVYTKGQETLSLIFSPKEVSKALLTPLRRNILLNLSIEGGDKRDVMVKDLQVHPIKRHLLHIDFIEVDPKSEVVAPVPLTVFGKSQAVVKGGKLDQVVKTLNVRCLPGQIPEKLELDITDLPFGATHADRVPMPEGVKLVSAANLAVVTIKIPKAVEEEAAKTAEAAPAAAKPAPAKKA